jgi:hypothetical protein
MEQSPHRIILLSSLPQPLTGEVSMKLTIAALALLASTGLALAQNAGTGAGENNNTSNSNSNAVGDSTCNNDQNLPLDQLPEKCRNQLQGNTGTGTTDGTTTGSTTMPGAADDATTPGVMDEQNDTNDATGNTDAGGSNNSGSGN